jgi:phospholipid N-methyltransferase
VTILDTYGNGGAPFTRTIPFDKLSGGVMSAADVQAKRDAGLLVDTGDTIGFGLLTPHPAPDPEAPLRELWTSQGVSPERQEEVIASVTAAAQPGARVGPFTIGERIESMRDTLKTGVQVVSAPQLFPTPAPLAARMVELADLAPGHLILEPSAGTGVLVEAIHAENLRQGTKSDIVAVEINPTLAHRLAFSSGLSGSRVIQGDFLEQNGNLGMFDRILMNPPFANCDDIKHIKHALSHLNPGGRLVAICANGPRQTAVLKPIVETRGGMWQELAESTFSSAGTNVRTILLTVNG